MPMYTRSESINNLEVAILAMKQNLAIMRKDAKSAAEISRNAPELSEYRSFTQRSDGSPKPQPEGLDKYTAWARSFIDLLFRMRYQLTSGNLHYLVKTNVVTNEDLKQIAAFIDLILQTDESQFIHYSINLQSHESRIELATKMRNVFREYCSKQAELEIMQGNILKEAGIDIKGDKNLRENINEARKIKIDESTKKAEAAKTAERKVIAQEKRKARMVRRNAQFFHSKEQVVLKKDIHDLIKENIIEPIRKRFNT